MPKPNHAVHERINARGKERRVWDVYDANGYAVLEVISDTKGLHVFDGDGSKVAFVPQGDTRNAGVEVSHA